MKGKGMSGHQRPYQGKSDEWQTPPEILTALGPFDDDVASAGRKDGLTRQWRGFVWCNPPYGPEVEKWIGKMWGHGNGIALVFARTETRWFRDVWHRAHALLFLYGRLHFYKNGNRAKGNSGAPSVLIAYGQEAVDRLRKCKLPGAFVRNWEP